MFCFLNEIIDKQLSMVLWSFAKSKIEHEELFSSAESHIIAMINENTMSDFDYTNIAWAYTKNSCMSAPIYKAIACRGTTDASEMEPHVLSKLAFSMSIPDDLARDPELGSADMFEALALAACKDIDSYVSYT